MIAAAERQMSHDEIQPDPYCTKCGSPTVTACEHCSARIKVTQRPSYCGHCGKPFPWTEEHIKAAKEYADELDQLDADEKAIFKETIVDLTAETPRTELAVQRFAKFMRKIGPTASSAMKSIIVDVVTTEVKKKLGL